MKEVDVDKSVYEITEQYPELIPILKDIGFAGVSNPIARNTLGRTMTLRKGSERQGLDLAAVTKTLQEKGFSIKP